MTTTYFLYYIYLNLSLHFTMQGFMSYIVNRLGVKKIKNDPHTIVVCIVSNFDIVWVKQMFKINILKTFALLTWCKILPWEKI